tara:strand:+ start:483 stop:1103 length:621 start_codon:yes stop_codon:yes gene_type:complete
MNPIKFYLILLFFVIQSFAADIKITDIKINSKKNGVFLTISSNQPLSRAKVTGWYSENGWFYTTIMNARIDTNMVETIKTPSIVNKINLHNTSESVQISIKVPLIEMHDFFDSDNPNELMLALRFPISSIENVLSEAKSVHESNLDMQTAFNYNQIRNAALLVGASLSIAGIISSDEQETIRWEFITGVGLLIATYLYDRYIQLIK